MAWGNGAMAIQVIINIEPAHLSPPDDSYGKKNEPAPLRRIVVPGFGEARNALMSDSLKVLQQTARDRRNVFEQLIEAVKYNSLGQISHALYDVGGEYRRNM